MNNEILTEKMIERMLTAASNAAKCEEKYEWYLYHSVETLYKMALKCDQINKPTEVVKCNRVVRLRRMIPKYVLSLLDKHLDEKTGCYERTFCSGLYVSIPCIIIPKDIVESKCCIKCGKYNMYTTKIKEIEDLHVNLAERTFRINNDGSATVLIEDNLLTGYLNSGNNYNLLEFYDEDLTR